MKKQNELMKINAHKEYYIKYGQFSSFESCKTTSFSNHFRWSLLTDTAIKRFNDNSERFRAYDCGDDENYAVRNMYDVACFEIEMKPEPLFDNTKKSHQ